MHIGLIGGIGPAATDFYYRRLIKKAADRGRDLDLPIVHADTSTLLKHLMADDQAAQCAIYNTLTARLAAAGAENVVVTSIAGHFCIDMFAKTTPLPIFDLTSALSAWLRRKGLTRVGILGTETVMRSGMYGKLAPTDVMAPPGGLLQGVHDAYVTLAKTGQPAPELTKTFLDAGRALMASGAQAILLGGTDLNAVFGPEESAFPIVDCAGIHADAVAECI